MELIRLLPVQALPTSGARAAAVFRLNGILRLATPQLAQDIQSQPADIDGGNSDNTLPLFRWANGSFEPWMELPIGGGEHWETFTLAGRTFAAIARRRSGVGPYDGNVESYLLEWRDDHFETRQKFPTFAAKQWRAFEVKGRFFLALAQGAEEPRLVARNPSDSCIFEWTGDFFRFFQKIPSRCGYNFHHFELDGADYLAYADHAAPSVIYRWNGDGFRPVQEVAADGGRAFCFFAIGDARYLAFAGCGECLLMRWNGLTFETVQTLSGQGGTGLSFTVWRNTALLALVKFFDGTHASPEPVTQSILLSFDGKEFRPAAEFTTHGGTDAAFFHEGDETYLAVTESLNGDLRFRVDSHIYRLANTE